MSNYTSCVFILTQLIGFEKSDNGEKITLADQVKIDTLIQFKNALENSDIENKLQKNELSSSHEMKMIENNEFWSCNHCTYHNTIELDTCKMCCLPRYVCSKSIWNTIFHSHHDKLHSCVVFMILQKKSRMILRKWTMMKNKKYVQGFHRKT